MRTQKLLLVDPSVEFCMALKELLGDAYQLQVCHDGYQACNLLLSFRPDVLVMDLALPGMDGIAVLKNAVSHAHRPAVLVTTRFVSSYIEAAMESLGVDYVMVKPCDMCVLTDRIHDMLACAEHPVFLHPSPQTVVTNMLLALNLSPKRRGFRCLETAILLFGQDPGQSVTKILYPEVAKRCDGSRESVERAIRTVIHTAWAQRDEDVWRLYFTPCRDGTVPRPTNTVFIARLADCLNRQKQECSS